MSQQPAPSPSPTPAASLTIVQPAGNAVFNIDTAPQMPTIMCQARINGVQPDPTANSQFDWSVQVTETITPSSCPSSTRGNCQLTVLGANVRGGNWTPAFPSIQGGDAVIILSTMYQGTRLQATVNIRIRGTNPASAMVTARLGGARTAADLIACRESGRRQFVADGTPVLGPGGDVGVMQLCNPAASCGQRWSWTANVDAGLALINQKQAEATRYLNQHQVNGHYPNNQNLSDADVLLRETIQRYNGGAYWRWVAGAAPGAAPGVPPGLAPPGAVPAPARGIPPVGAAPGAAPGVPPGRWNASPPNNYVAQVLACH